MELAETLIEGRVHTVIERIFLVEKCKGASQILRGERRIDVLAQLDLWLRAGQFSDLWPLGGRLFHGRHEIFKPVANL